MRRIALALVLVLATAVPAGAVDGAHTIAPTALGGAKLGQSRADYVAVFGPAFASLLGDGSTQLAFSGPEVSVYLVNGRGVRISTSAEEFRTARGVGPCSPAAKLFRTYGKAVKPLQLPGPSAVSAYRVGSLWFTIRPNRTIGNVTLASGQVPVTTLIGSPQCGESGEGD